MAQHRVDDVQAGMADAGTGPIPVTGRPAAGRGGRPAGGPASATAPQTWAAPPQVAPGPPAGFVPARPRGGGPFPPPRAAGPGPVVPPPGVRATAAAAGPMAPRPQAVAPQAAASPGGALRPPAFGRPGPQGRRSPPPQRPLRRASRNAAVVAFVLHQFPIGHMPVAASRACMQLPSPPPESGGFTGHRFLPEDHPQSSSIDGADALARVRAGAVAGQPVAEGVPVPAELVAAHEPFGGLTERDWEHEYLVRQAAGEPVEYAWPATDSSPSTGQAEALLLEPDTMLDRIGVDSGRFLAPEGTPFAERSLPPEYRERAFRRYRVLRRLPVWRTVSVPWFGQPGGAVCYRTTAPVADLVAMGYLAELTTREPVESPTVRIKEASGAPGEQ